MTPDEHETRLLLPVDDSPSSRRAVDFVAQRETHSEVTLLHVAAIPPKLLEHPGAEDPTEEKALERKKADELRRHATAMEESGYEDVFGPAEERLEEAGLTVRRELVTEPHPKPARAIVDVARRGEFDGVVVGRHDRGAVGEWLLSTVADEVRDALGEDLVTIVD